MSKRMRIFQIFLVVFIVFHSLPVYSGSRVAILRYRNSTGIDDLAGLAEDLTGFALKRVGAVSLVERRKLDKLLEELSISITDVIDDSTAVKVGRLANAQYVVLGNVSKAAVVKAHTLIEVSREGEGPQEKYECTVLYGVRIVDVETGVVIYSGTSRGKSSWRVLKSKENKAEDPVMQSDMAIKALNDSKGKLENQLKGIFLVEGYIIQVIDEKNVVLDIGLDDGIRKGMEFDVIRPGKMIKHPITGDLVPRPAVPLGKIKITQADPRVSKAKRTKLFDNNDPFRVGDRFRSQQPKKAPEKLPNIW